MFATFTIEREPLRLEYLPAGIEYWLQVAGGYGLLGVVLWLLFGLPNMRRSDRALIPGWQTALFLLSFLAAIASYLYLFLPRLPGRLVVELSGAAIFVVAFWAVVNFKGLRDRDPSRIPLWQLPLFFLGIAALALVVLSIGYKPGLDRIFNSLAQATKDPLSLTERRVLDIASLCALFAAGLPFLRSLASFRMRRIMAIAKLSFKEALRRRVLYAFSALILVFLFASWFLPTKPEDQVRSYVSVVFDAKTYLLLFTASIIAAFSIPTDIRQLTIHTVVTKPVEKFEIVLGRFLGFTALMTLVLFVLTGFSLLYVLRGVGPDAAAESLKARVPVYGELFFENSTNKYRGDNVGREWEYRSYISAPHTGQDSPTACWGFPQFTGSALNRDYLRCEFTFDIYRTTKGEENKGVSCFFTFHTGPYNRDRESAYRLKREKERQRADAPSEAQLNAQLAEEFGFFEVPSTSVIDYHTQSLDVPAALFRRALQETSRAAPDQPQLLPLQVRVKCISRTQYVGMAKHDLYFRLDDPDSGADTTRFAFNFFKGAVGLWFRLCLVTGIAVCLSTYFTGVISMLLALLLLVGGQNQDFIQTVGLGTNIGGGPTEALIRLVGREAITTPREDTTAQKVAFASDNIFRWVIRRVLDFLPDVERFSLKDYVAEGFNISGTQLGMDALLLIAYLLPWFVLAYFVMKWREIATW